MKKKSLAILITVAFIGSSLSIPAFAAVKAGATCKTKGQVKTDSNLKYTCSKSGKRLVWSKSVLILKPKVTPFVAWSTKFQVNSLIKSAIDSTDAYSGVVRPDNSYEISIENSVRESDRKWIMEMLNYTNGFFSKIEREKLKIFLGNSHLWSKETLKNAGVWIGDPNGIYPCSSGLQDAYCAGYKNLILLIFLNPSQIMDIGRRSTPAHELFHTVQFELLGYKEESTGPDPRRVPTWLKEGSANYFGFYMVEKLGFAPYKSSRNFQLLSTYNNFETNPYSIGQAATEYIIASVGFENLLNIFKFTGTEGSFSAGFKKATGIELSEFYSKFEDARSSMGIGS